MKIKLEEGLTFDDLLLLPNYSDVLPSAVITKTLFSQNLEINIPVVSSAMDTVTEARMASMMASLGGLGIIHKNLTPDLQTQQVEAVKQIHIDKKKFPLATLDKKERLMVGAAVGVSDKEFERAQKLIKAHIDVIIVDTAHGHSKGVIEMVKKLRKNYKTLEIVAGNVATAQACLDLIKAGVNGIKVGIGPGSICTTRVVAGIGVPQMHAIFSCREICLKHKVPFISDGGIQFSGDIVKAIAGGANSVMIGSLFAGTDESPGELVHYQGRSFKVYRGMGSMGAMGLGSKDRYAQSDVHDTSKLVPEGIEGQVPYCGSVEQAVYQLIGGLRSGMGYLGAKTIVEMQKKAKFIKISQASLKESHPHGVMLTTEAPNYRGK
jgi:IMP dehydrogenase